MQRIAVYGKGGIGKSTTVTNVAAALASQGLKVMQIGCDPKADSTFIPMGRTHIPAILDVMRATDAPSLCDIVHEGAQGVLCAEAGGPLPGTGCAGRGVITAFETLEELEAFETYGPDVVIYDVLGDVVCGGFSLPMRAQYSDVVYVVTSGEMMSMYAASNIASAVERFKARGYARMGGLILNRRNVEGETEKVQDLARELGCAVVGDIPRDPEVQLCEQRGLTVMGGAPESEIAAAYRRLAQTMIDAAEGEGR